MICAICNTEQRNLTQDICPSCWASIHAPGATSDMYQSMLPLGKFPLDEGVVVRRRGDKMGRHTTATNVPHFVVKHSPDGFAWGYHGSGPAELALNVVEYYVRVLRNQGLDIGKVYPANTRGEYHAVTGGLYQDFKREFIAQIPDEGGTVPANTIINWIKERL